MTIRPTPDELLPWALTALPGFGQAPATATAADLTMVAGDASNRRYFRLTVAGQSFMAMEAPPSTEKNSEFVFIQRLLAAAGVRVPELIATDMARGFMLLEDLGDHMLLPALNPDSAGNHYRSAFGVLHKMAAFDMAGQVMPEYDLALLSEELSRFDAWFVEALLGHDLAASERALIARFGQALLTSALEQPQVLVHRDFHSRNLMLLEGNELAVIDFQDAVLGPASYDLASLLKDCYIRWPADQVRAWALEYRDGLRGDRVDDAQFLRWFNWMGLQRHIKVLGTFARLALRDGKSAYLDDLPLVLLYIEETLAQYSEQEPVFAEFHAWFLEILAPLIAEQPWSVKP